MAWRPRADDAAADRAPPMRPSAGAKKPGANFNDRHAGGDESSPDAVEMPAAMPPGAMAEQHATYHPRDALHNTGNAMLSTGMVGAVFAGVQNTLRKQNVGAMGILTRSGGIIALFGAPALNWRGRECWGAN